MKKKLLAAVISVIAAISVCTAFAVPAMAAINVYSPQGVAIICSINDPLVNKKPSNQLTGVQKEPGSKVITFTYSGSSKLLGWSFVNGAGQEVSLASLSDSCRIISQEGNTLVIEITNLDTFQAPDGYTVNANVEVKNGESESTTGKKDNSSKSPSTGAVSIVAASVAAAGAGIAVIALAKKKDAE